MRIVIFFVLLSQMGFAQSNSKPTEVVIFMATDCPITQKYMHTIRLLAKRYRKQLTVTGYFPAGINPQAERDFRKEYSVPALVKLVDDKSHTYTNRLGANITPEAFLLDNKGVIIYSGAIDNWFFELGRYRPTVTEHYLVDAIEASLKGSVPAITSTETVGCSIQKSNQKEHLHPH
ncbi:MAG: hypothetical protein J0L66_14040 [Cytophagales bacterium]|nr:hypothetical protein [Cytophagales bacterium]